MLDRTNGAFLFGTQCVKNVTWATGLDNRGRPLTAPNMEPSLEGSASVPRSMAPRTGIPLRSIRPPVSITSRPTTNAVSSRARRWRRRARGSWAVRLDKPRMNGAASASSNRYPDRQTGMGAPQSGAVNSWGGVLSTAGGTVFFGEDSGALMAADAASGTPCGAFRPVNSGRHRR